MGSGFPGMGSGTMGPMGPGGPGGVAGSGNPEGAAAAQMIPTVEMQKGGFGMGGPGMGPGMGQGGFRGGPGGRGMGPGGGGNFGQGRFGAPPAAATSTFIRIRSLRTFTLEQ